MDWQSNRGRAGSSKRTVHHTRIEDDEEIDVIFRFGVTLGQGSFGTVTEAFNNTSKARFAVKSINKEKAGSAGVKLLEREVSIMKTVYHKHIVHLEEVYETSKKMYLVMELCDKGSLDYLLKKRTRFCEEETLCIMKQLFGAVVYLHEKNIVHRDLKLENILLCEPDSEDNLINIKLTDFGLSYIRGGAGSDYMMQQVCGTPMYMAPEVITNFGYSERCDVWSCGVILYYLLNGTPPFVANSEEELHDLIKAGEIKYSDFCWDSVSMTAKQLINWMMRVDPARRCSAKEVMHDPWILGTKHSTNGPRLNVLDLMGEELMRQKLEKSLSTSRDDNENGEDLLSNNNETSLNAPASPRLGKSTEKKLKTPPDSMRTSKSFEKRSLSLNSKKGGLSPVGQIERRVDSPFKDKKTESTAGRCVPSYMQPTKSSSAPKNPNIKGRTKK